MEDGQVPADEEVVASMTPEQLNEAIRKGSKDPANAPRRRFVIETDGMQIFIAECELSKLEAITVCHKLLEQMGEK